MKHVKQIILFLVFLVSSGALFASEADLKIPDLHEGHYPYFFNLTAWQLLFFGAWIIVGTLGISLFLFSKIKKLPAHKSMLDVADTIYKTCRTYLIQQGKFLSILFGIVSIAIIFYLIMANSAAPGEHKSIPTIVTIVLVLLFSISSGT